MRHDRRMTDSLPQLPAVRPRRRRSPWEIVGLVLLGIVVVFVALLAWAYYEVTVPDDGDLIARDRGEQIAVDIADDLEGYFADPVDAETLATRVLDDDRAPGAWEEVDIVLLGWDGASGDDGGARIDVAIAVRVPGAGGAGYFDPGRSAGSSTVCWRFVVFAYQHDDAADREWLRCPAELVAAAPDPDPQPSLGRDAGLTAVAVLDGLPAAATAEDVTAALRAAFPVAEVRAVREGTEVVAAVGVARARHCVVVVRDDGEPTWQFSDFDKILIEPGELGCVPDLYLHPVVTH